MRNDQKFNPKPESPQLQIPGLGMQGEQEAKAAYEWIASNPDAWEFMEANAQRLASSEPATYRFATCSAWFAMNFASGLAIPYLRHSAGFS